MTAYDASLILQDVVNLIQLSYIQRINADVTGNKSVSAYDAALVLQFSVKLIDKFPVEGEASPTIAGIGNRIHTLSVENATVKDGGRVTVPVSLDDGKGIFAGSFDLAYDDKLLKFISASTTKLTPKYSLVHNTSHDNVKIAFAGLESIKGNGTIVNVEFDVLPNVAPSTPIPLRLADAQLNENSRVRVCDGSITVFPIKTKLAQNYPNPFNPETWIPYQLAEEAEVTINIYNLKGQLVRRLNIGRKSPGYYINKSKAAHWDGRNVIGERVASGVYFYTLRTGDFQAIRKMIIIK